MISKVLDFYQFCTTANTFVMLITVSMSSCAYYPPLGRIAFNMLRDIGRYTVALGDHDAVDYNLSPWHVPEIKIVFIVNKEREAQNAILLYLLIKT